MGAGMVTRIRRRKDFIMAAAAPAVATSSVVVQARQRGDDAPARTGFTVTKKLGNAVERNRARRRLKEAVRLGLADALKPGADYVFVGRAATGGRPFTLLIDDLRKAVATLDRGGGAVRPPRGKPASRAGASKRAMGTP
jgi:ribonuclease P protein component